MSPLPGQDSEGGMTSDPFARPRKYFTIGVLVSGALVALAWCVFEVLPWRSPNWYPQELSKRVSAMIDLSGSARAYTKSHGGEPPESLAELIRATPELSDPDLVRHDEQNRVLSRAVLLRGVRAPTGKVHKWLIVLLMPKDRVIKSDMICATGDLVGLGWISVEEAEQLYGREVVEAAYRRDREDRARVATQPVKSAE